MHGKTTIKFHIPYLHAIPILIIYLSGYVEILSDSVVEEMFVLGRKM